MDLIKKLLKADDMPSFISELSTDEIVSMLKYATKSYSQGKPVLSDDLFDALMGEIFED